MDELDPRNDLVLEGNPRPGHVLDVETDPEDAAPLGAEELYTGDAEGADVEPAPGPDPD